MKTFKDLSKKLVSKIPGHRYVYVINNTRFEIICEFNNCKRWCLNAYRVSTDEYINGYGYEGFLLRDCKTMILSQWIYESNGYEAIK